MGQTTTDHAWSEFWAQQGPHGCSGCLPARWQSVFATLERTWRAFASRLPQGARVLDLATGDARVLHWIGTSRPDAVLTGIDLAPQLPQPPPGVDLHPATAMEDLPFADASFDAIVSQFGVEYGDTPQVAQEIARVASEDAAVGMVVHRGDGAILSHNLARAEQIRWVLDEMSLMAETRAALNDEPPPWPDATAMVAEIVEQGRAKHGDQSAAWEIPEAVRRSLLMGAQAGDTATGLTTLLDRIEAQAHNELARIASLEGACATADARDNFLGAFADAGLAVSETEELSDAAGRVFAEMIALERT